MTPQPLLVLPLGSDGQLRQGTRDETGKLEGELSREGRNRQWCGAGRGGRRASGRISGQQSIRSFRVRAPIPVGSTGRGA